jgi:lysozyme
MNLIEQLRRDEGEKLKMYKDSKGIWTIGVGHNLETTPISAVASSRILLDDIRDKTTEIEDWPAFKALDEVRQGCLINMAFTMGAEGLRTFQKLLAACEIKDYAEAAAQIRDSDWYRVEAPLRAERIARQMETGIWQ